MLVVIVGLVLVAFLIASLFVRRHGESDRPGADWRSTDEIFNDPSTNRLVRVWLDAAGERHYVPESKKS